MDYDHSEIKIEVLDNGCGIPEEILFRIKEKGFSYQKKNGSGLGLFYTESRIKESGGKIFIDSQLNKGTRVSLHLPRKIPPYLTS